MRLLHTTCGCWRSLHVAWLFLAGAFWNRAAAEQQFDLKIDDTAWRELRFLIVSAPVDGTVLYKILPDFETQALPLAKQPQTGMSVLIGQGLTSPQGIAVHTGKDMSRRLYVSDCEKNTIYRYDLFPKKDKDYPAGYLTAGAQIPVLRNIPGGARWITVDGLGNLFFTVEESNEIQRIDVSAIDCGKGAKCADTASSTPVYTQTGSDTVSSPGGIVADNFNLFWVNKASGQAVGSLIRAYERPRPGSMARANNPLFLSKNVEKAYGVCMIKDTIFYTAATSTVFAVKKTGGTIAEVSSQFQEPRGCAWDGDGALYVADRQANAIYSMAANMMTLRAIKTITKVADVNQPCQVAILVAGRAGSITKPAPLVFAAVLGWVFASQFWVN